MDAGFDCTVVVPRFHRAWIYLLRPTRICLVDLRPRPCSLTMGALRLRRPGKKERKATLKIVGIIHRSRILEIDYIASLTRISCLTHFRDTKRWMARIRSPNIESPVRLLSAIHLHPTNTQRILAKGPGNATWTTLGLFFTLFCTVATSALRDFVLSVSS